MCRLLCLCSGGFDSVVLLHNVRDNFPKAEIHTLFFDYKQGTAKYERECSKKASEKLNCIFHEISLPKFEWTKSDFYKEGYFESKDMCIEMRNMIFASYALSLAISLKVDSVYMAILKSISYYDTSESFISKISSIFEDVGIALETPFSNMHKSQLAFLANFYEITPKDFISCDSSINGVPCGVCSDCKVINEILNYTPAPITEWLNCFDPCNKRFQESIVKYPIEEMRVYTNLDCQLHCEHCYYGYSTIEDPPLTLEEWREVFIQAKEEGINAFHFSGKEPLYDSFVFDVIKVLKEVHPNSNVSFVTNGINIPKYASEIAEVSPSKVCLSVDEVVSKGSIRNVKNIANKAICCLQEKNVPIEIFVDLHSGNIECITNILNVLKDKGISNILIRTVVPVGKAENFTPIPIEELDKAYKDIKNFSRIFPSISISVVFGILYTYKIMDEYPETLLCRDFMNVMDSNSFLVMPNLSLKMELFCASYQHQITITPDGYIQGCASETSYCDYRNRAVGSVRIDSLHNLIQKGKEISKTNTEKIFKNGNISCICSLKPLDLL